jgi:diguanylate cyclase (GGDEF)-like protein
VADSTVRDGTRASRPGFAARASRRPSPTVALTLFGAALAGVAALLVALLGALPARPDGPDAQVGSVLLLLALFAAAESTQIHVEVRRQTFSASLSAFPLVLGLFLLPAPWWLLVARLAPAAVIFAVRRTALPKAAFNLCLFAAEVALAEFVLRAGAAGNGLAARDWLVAYLAVVVVDVAGSAAVVGAMRMLQGSVSSKVLVRMLATVTISGALGTTLALISLLVHDAAGARGAALLAALGTVATIAYVGYARLLRRHADLGQLFSFTQTVGAAGSGDELVDKLLDEARDILQAESAVLRLAPEDGDHADPPLFTDAVVIPRGTRDPLQRAWLAQASLRDALLVPLEVDGRVVAVLQVGNRLGAMSTFTASDLNLLQTLCAHTEVVLRNGRLMEQLRHDAEHDDLTGLANRALFQHRLAQRLEQLADADGAARGEAQAAVLLVDLDRFKDVNDTLGHHVGDLLLRRVAERLRTGTSDDVMVARLGGDEFAVLLPTLHSAEEAADRAAGVHAALTGSYEIADVFLDVAASVGVALIPLDGRNPAAVLQHADVAMYTAKRAGGGVAFYRPDDDRSSLDRLALAGDLRRAIDAGQLLIHYQPKACLSTGRLVGYEGLVRWAHPTRGLLMPDVFVPIAEQTGLIGPLTTAVLRGALAQCAGWLDDAPDVGVAVNLSPRGLLDEALPREVAALLRDSGVPPELLTLEMTETGVMGDPEAALKALNGLRRLGVRLALDDFGTGYSSLSHLRLLPFDEVKVDKSFIAPMAVDPGAAAIVQAIVDLAHSMRLTVVVEGVEDEQTCRTLAEKGCDTMQGFYLSSPLPAPELAAWQAAYRSSRGAA